jgi:hypothetical protein
METGEKPARRGRNWVDSPVEWETGRGRYLIPVCPRIRLEGDNEE